MTNVGDSISQGSTLKIAMTTASCLHASIVRARVCHSSAAL